MVLAMLFRSPRRGRTSSAAVCGGGAAVAGPRRTSAWASTSAFITRPCGPLPWSCARSRPISRAILRVTGVARTRRSSPFPPGVGACAVCSGAGCPAGGVGAACAGAPVEGGAAVAPAPSTSSRTSVWCTLAIAPSSPKDFTTLPRRGLGMVTVALSVITSTSGWSSVISSPGLTSHLTISPSTTPSPMSGSLNSNWAMSGLVGCELAQAFDDARREREVVVFQRVGEGRVPAGDAQHRRLHVSETALVHQRADLRREAARARRFLHDGAAARLAHALDHRVHVERPERAQIDQLGIEIGELLASRGCFVQHRAPRDHRHAAPIAHLARLADGNGVLAFGHLALCRAIDALRLHEDHRILGADGADEQTFGVDGIARIHDLQPRRVDEERLRRLRMIVAAFDASAHRRADHDRRRVLAAASITKLCQLVYDLIESRIDEVAELDLRHRPQPVHRHPDGRTDDPRLRQRRVDHPVRAELLEEADRGAEHAAELAHVFAEDDHARVPAHLDLQGVIDRLDDVPARHQLPTNAPALRPSATGD